jgi:hypothetical protein
LLKKAQTHKKANNGRHPLGECRYLIFLVFVLFLASFCSRVLFSKSRLCSWHFVTNLDWLAGQPMQIIFAVKIFFLVQIFYVLPRGINPVGNNCMMTKASLQRGRQGDGGILGG